MSEKVNHPPHYQREGRKECIEEMREKYGDYITFIFCLTNAYKYLYRAGAKEDSSAEQDIAKARFYRNYALDLFVRGDACVPEFNQEDMLNWVRELGFRSQALDEFIGKELKKNENNKTEL